jgi:hypothetical protein
MTSLLDKRALLIEKINNANENTLDKLLQYDFFDTHDADPKVDKIIDGLKPFITMLYLSLDEETLDKLFNKAI